MLGKQWLNRYASTDMRGTAIERSQNRQRKLDGIVAWHFDYVMELLPLMLQAALLLLGCALSRYLWGINTTVAFVVIGVTSSGIIVCIIILLAGAAFESCPYQTLGSRALRYLAPKVQKILHSALSTISLVAFGRGEHNTSSTPEQGLDQQEIKLDLPCISWMLRTFLDKAVRLSSLKHFMAIASLADFHPTLVADCLSIFIGCVIVNRREVVITHESEELATVSATCFLRTFHHLSITDPTSSVFADLHQRYNDFFPLRLNFRGLPFHYTMAKIHDLVSSRIEWSNYRPSARGHTAVARDIAQAAEVEYEKTQHGKVPRWTLHFALRSLSLDPLPPPHVVADCLSIIAIDLGCVVSNTRGVASDECVLIPQVTFNLT